MRGGGIEMWIKVTIVLVLALLLMPLTACAQSASDIANEHKILLDTDIEVIDTVNYASATYHAVKYNNILPYARGIEVISADGFLISDPEIAKSVLTQIAWKETAAQLNSSDIGTLKEILDTAKNINNTVPSVMSAINIVRGELTSIKTWDVVVTAYPEVLTLRSDLKSLNIDLNEWGNSSTEIIEVLPEVINGLEDVRAGKGMDPILANNIQESTSAFGMLKTETDGISNKLSGTVSTLSEAESTMRSAAARTSIVNYKDTLYTLADCIEDLKNKLKALREDARLFPSSLSEQSLKLPTVVNVANEKQKDLYDSWNSRRGASALIYLTLGEIIAVIPVILAGVLIYRRRKEGEGEGEGGVEKEEDKEEEGEE